ncbi:MAG: diguanylate cyclase domain-containing protein [Anaerorhabdus sp.]|uniref:sensor domain-containing diguanylate cyclase n=1 Tax=Anaerorhabdus sp. TaxID=1872524 RepID=UPI003A89BCAC
MKVKYRLPLIIVFMSTIPIFIIGIIAYFLITNFSLNNYNTILSNQSRAASKHLEDFYYEQSSTLEYASQLEINALYLDSYNNNDETKMKELQQSVKDILDVTVTTNEYVEESFLVDKTSRILSSSNEKTVNKLLTDIYPYEPYNTSIKTLNVYYEIIQEKTGKKILMFAPITNKKNEVVGALIQKINLNYINHYIKELKIGTLGYLYVLDYNGNTLSHYYDDRVQLAPKNEDRVNNLLKLINQIKDNTLTSESNFFDYKIHNLSIHAYYDTIPSTGWVVVSAIPYTEIYAKSSQLLFYLFTTACVIIVVSLSIGLMAVKHIINPLQYISERIKNIASGDFSQRCVYSGNDEFKSVCENVNQMTDNLSQSYQRLEESAKTDILTLLPNRNAIYSVMDNLFNTQENQACILLDLDGFKNVNDCFGHDHGDDLLISVAKVLRSETKENVYISRLGGDEFLIFISRYESKEEVLSLANDILEKVNNISVALDKPIYISASLDIAFIDDKDENKSRLIKKADLAMYSVKSKSKSGIEIYQGNPSI